MANSAKISPSVQPPIICAISTPVLDDVANRAEPATAANKLTLPQTDAFPLISHEVQDPLESLFFEQQCHSRAQLDFATGQRLVGEGCRVQMAPQLFSQRPYPGRQGPDVAAAGHTGDQRHGMHEGALGGEAKPVAYLREGKGTFVRRHA